MGAVFTVLLDGIDRDDGFVEIVERVMVGRHARANPLEAFGVEADKGDREAGPEFFLELGHHRLDRQDEDAAAAAAPDHL